jgi:hypothetical protein
MGRRVGRGRTGSVASGQEAVSAGGGAVVPSAGERPGRRRHPWRRTLREGESQEHMNRLVKFIYPEVRPGCFPLRIDVDSGKKFYETQFNVTFRFWRRVHRSLGDFRCRNHCRVRWVPARLAPAGGSSSPGQHHPLSTRCTRWMAVSCARRAWQEGHTPRDLHEKGTSTSPRHAVQASRAKPWASTPQARWPHHLVQDGALDVTAMLDCPERVLSLSPEQGPALPVSRRPRPRHRRRPKCSRCDRRRRWVPTARAVQSRGRRPPPRSCVRR